MTAPDAAKLLDLPVDATPEQIETRFNELRAKLEDKVAKAPTPGLKAKYRESLDEITAAFETLTLAADASALPMLNKQQSAVSRQPSAAGPASPRAAAPASGLRSQVPALPAKPKASSKEFAIVAALALVVLAGGGWFVMKTRAEKAEQTRLADVAKAEADRQAQTAREHAEQVRRSTEAEKERLEKLAGQLRGELAEYKVAWEAAEREERNAERRLSDLKSDLRSLRDAPPGKLAEARALVSAQEDYYSWLSDSLARHPAKVARSRAEELLSARQVEDAQRATLELKQALAGLEKEITRKKTELLDIDGELALQTDANVSWTLADAFGQTRSGRGPEQLDGLAVGAGSLTLTKPSWPVRTETFVIRRDRPVQLDATYKPSQIDFSSDPAGAEIRNAEGTVLGVTPLHLGEIPPGKLTLTVRKQGYYDQPLALTFPRQSSEPVHVELRVRPKGLAKPTAWNPAAHIVTETNTRTTVEGAFGSTSTIHSIEEMQFSRPDPAAGWLEVTRQYVRLEGPDVKYIPRAGSVLRQQRQADGSWKGNFLQGGLPESTYNYIWEATAPSAWLVTCGLLDWWPAEEVAVGGTWKINPEKFLPALGLGQMKAISAEGKLLALERTAEEEWAEVLFSYSYGVGDKSRSNDSIKARIDLKNGYITRTEHSSLISGDISARGASTVTVTRR